MDPIAFSQDGPGIPAFCPACWSAVSSSDSRCRNCGAEIEALSSRSYPQKLLAALEHPIGEVRERAARLLGEIGGREAYEPLARIASEGRDPYLSATALESLARLLTRFPDLPPVAWEEFAKPDRPITVRVAAVAISERGPVSILRRERDRHD